MRAPSRTPVAVVHVVPGPTALVVRRIVAVLVVDVHRVVVHHHGGRGRHDIHRRQAANAAANDGTVTAAHGRRHRAHGIHFYVTLKKRIFCRELIA